MVPWSALFPQIGCRPCPRTALTVAGVLHVPPSRRGEGRISARGPRPSRSARPQRHVSPSPGVPNRCDSTGRSGRLPLRWKGSDTSPPPLSSLACARCGVRRSTVPVGSSPTTGSAGPAPCRSTARRCLLRTAGALCRRRRRRWLLNRPRLVAAATRGVGSPPQRHRTVYCPGTGRLPQ